MSGHNNDLTNGSRTGEAIVEIGGSQVLPIGLSPLPSPPSPLERQSIASPGLARELPSPSLSSHDGQHSSVSPESAPNPSPSPARSGFQALSEASSCSPDPESMAIAPSPSIAELLATTINSVNNRNKTSSSKGSADSNDQVKPPSSKRIRISSRPLSAHDATSPSITRMESRRQSDPGMTGRSPQVSSRMKNGTSYLARGFSFHLASSGGRKSHARPGLTANRGLSYPG